MKTSPLHLTLWQNFQENFKKLLPYLSRYDAIVKLLKTDEIEYYNNILLYGVYGFPLELLAMTMIEHALGIDQPTRLQPTCHSWNNKIPYNDFGYFLQINFNHPDMTKDIASISDFLKTIIQTKSMLQCKRHILLISNIDAICSAESNTMFRVILERFSSNVLFICCSYKYSKIEPPLRSRFQNIRVPLLQIEEFKHIYDVLLWKHHFPIQLFEQQQRNLLKTWYMASSRSKLQMEIDMESKKTVKSATSIEYIRNMANKYFQSCTPLPTVICLHLSKVPKSLQTKYLKICSTIEQQWKQVGKGREPLYYEIILIIAYFIHIL